MHVDLNNINWYLISSTFTIYELIFNVFHSQFLMKFDPNNRI